MAKEKRKRFPFSLQPPIYSSFLFSFQLSLQTRAWKRFLDRPEQTHLVLTDLKLTRKTI